MLELEIFGMNDLFVVCYLLGMEFLLVFYKGLGEFNFFDGFCK